MNRFLQAMTVAAVCALPVLCSAETQGQTQTAKQSRFSFAKTTAPAVNPENYENPEMVKELLDKRANTVARLRESYGSAVRKSHRAKEIQAEMKKLMDELVNIVEHDAGVMQVNDDLKQIDTELRGMPLKRVEPAKGDAVAPATAK